MTAINFSVGACDVETQCPFHVWDKENHWDPNCSGPSDFPCYDQRQGHAVSVRDWLRWLTDKAMEMGDD